MNKRLSEKMLVQKLNYSIVGWTMLVREDVSLIWTISLSDEQLLSKKMLFQNWTVSSSDDIVLPEKELLFSYRVNILLFK